MNIKTDTSPTDTNDPVRKDESIGDLQTVRSKQVDKALFVLLILGLPVLIATISRVVDIGWHPVEFFYCALYLVNLGTILFIKRLSFPVRISVLIGILFLLGISSLISFGLAANGILILATFSILISVLFGTKKGIIATGISLCMIGTIGVGVITGIITFAFDINNFVTSVTSWITAFAAFAFLIGIAVISSGAIQQYLANAFRELSKYRNQLEELVKARTAELSKSNEKLKQEMDEKKKTEETLRESEESLAMAQEVADVGSWDWKIKDDTLIWSDRTYRQFGLKPGEITPTYPAFEDFVHPDDRELINQRVEQALNEDKPYSVNARMVRTDGTEWIMHAQGVVYRGKDSEPIRFVGTQQDITHMVHAEEALRESEKKYRQQSKVLEGINRVFREALTCESEKQVANTCLAVAEEISDSKFGLIGEKNPEGRFDTIAISNPGWDVCKMPDSEATRLIQDMEIRGIDRTTIREEKSRIVNDPTSHPDRIGPPEGHPPITSFLGVPLKHSGKTIGMIGLGNKESGYDLSDQKAIEDLSIAFVEALMRKRAEEALRKSELWLYNIFNSLEEAVLVVTPDRKLISLNRSGQKMFGYSQEELVGVSTEVFHVNHEHYGEFGNQINEAFDRGEAANFEFEAKRKNGEIFPTEHTVSFLKSDQGEPLGIVSIVRDISKRKHAEEALRESEEKFRTLVDNLPVGVYRNSPGPEGQFIMANPAFCNMFGFKNEEEVKKVAPADLYEN
ncbi:MAG: PAS domain S-box protein, partial [Desulfobacteraceae bacterium]|nr:PAS domain S-box protein [Desulfobacteraceae bacterium]